MSETTSPTYAHRHPLWSSVTNRLVPILVVLYQIVALIALIVATINAYNYFQAPFIGSLVEHTLVLNGVDSVNPGT